MLLLDRNNEPTSTVYYIAGTLCTYVDEHPNLDVGQLYEATTNNLIKKELSYDFFIMALDFLFLLGRIEVNERGGLYVY